MTVTYTAQVATSSFSCFLKLLFRWRGSIYKLVWKDFALFSIIYYLLAFLYRFVLDQQQKKTFELISRYCEAYNNLIPVAFVLGFFVTLIITRWWNHIVRIPFADNMALYVMANIHGQDERARLMRRTIMRYMCLSYVIMMSSISVAVKKRFPTFQFMTEAGFMLPGEQKIIEQIKTVHNKFFAPLAWAASLINRARRENLIRDDFAVKTMMDVIVDFRKDLAHLWIQDWQTVPLVYTQVVTLAVYTFFLSCLMGRQFLDQSEMPDTYFPIFTFLQFFFYMGWLKVAESMINPFGEDDQDIELNYLIDKNLQVSYIIVDDMHAEHPELIRDQYWDMVEFAVPHTIASEQARTNGFVGSTMQLDKPLSEVPVMDVIDEEKDDDQESNEHVNMEFGSHVTSRPIPAPSSLFGIIAESLRSGKSLRSTRRMSRVGRSKFGQQRSTCSPVSTSHPRRSFRVPDAGSVCSLSPPQKPLRHHSPQEMFAMSELNLNKEGEDNDGGDNDDDDNNIGINPLHRQSTVGDFISKRKEYQLKRNTGFNNLGNAQQAIPILKKSSYRPGDRFGPELDLTAIIPLNNAKVHPDPEDWSLVACGRSRNDGKHSPTLRPSLEGEKETPAAKLTTNNQNDEISGETLEESTPNSPCESSTDLLPYFSHYKHPKK